MNEFVYVGDDMVNDRWSEKCGNDYGLEKNNARQLDGNTVPDKVIDHIGALPKAIKK